MPYCISVLKIKRTVQWRLNYPALFILLFCWKSYIDLHTPSPLTLLDVTLEARCFILLYMHRTTKMDLTRSSSILLITHAKWCTVITANKHTHWSYSALLRT